MCVRSMIMDHYHDKWRQPPYWPSPYVPNPFIPNTSPPAPPFIPPPVPTKVPTKEEIDEFYKLLERARQYDRDNNEPNCELEEKKQKLLKLAEELGIAITFPA